MNAGRNIAWALIAMWVAGLGLLLLIKIASAKRAQYIFTYETQVPDANCNNGYTDILIGGLDEARNYSLRGLKVSPDEIARFSNLCHRQIGNSYAIIQHEKTGLLKRILRKMQPYTKAGLNYEVSVVNDDEINAFTIAGGQIYFTTGLLNFVEDEDQLAMIMGHEIGHNENGHCIEYLKKKKYWESFLPNIEIWDVKLSELASFITNIEELITISFNQGDEKCADLCGAYLTYQAGYDPAKGKEIFAAFRMLEQTESRRAIDKFFRSHPYSEDRYFCLNDYINLAANNALQSEKKSEPFESILCRYKSLILYALGAGTILSMVLTWFTFLQKSYQNPLSLAALSLHGISLILFLSLPCVGFKIGNLFKFKGTDQNKIIVQQRGRVKTNGGRLILRAGPSITSEEIIRMPPSSILDCEYCCCDDVVEGRKGKWCQVTYQGYTGYAWGWYIQLE